MEEAKKRLKGKVIFKHETEADWLKSNYIPEDGEMVLYDEDDSYSYKRAKYGNGKDKVKDLPFSISTDSVPETTSDWDYVITNIEDFTTENLATMSGRVLVKEVEIDVSSATPLKVVLPKSITEIKFVNSKIYADIEASENSNTAIVGFVGNYFEDVAIGFYPILRGFNRVEYCEGFPKLYDCNNIERSVIHSANNCHSISNVYCFANFQDGDYTAFYHCSVISNITFRDEMGGSSSERIVDFDDCNHLSNIHALDPSVIINYRNCKNVVGETCDGYFTEAEQGKVQTVTTDGTSAFVSVYSQDEIDGKLGDISSILTALHEGGIE